MPKKPAWVPFGSGLCSWKLDGDFPSAPHGSMSGWGCFKYQFSGEGHEFEFYVPPLNHGVFLKKKGVRCHASTARVELPLDKLNVLDVIGNFGAVPEVTVCSDVNISLSPLQAETQYQDYMCPQKLVWENADKFTARLFRAIDDKWFPLMRSAEKGKTVKLLIGENDGMLPVGFISSFDLRNIADKLQTRITELFQHSVFPGAPPGMIISLCWLRYNPKNTDANDTVYVSRKSWRCSQINDKDNTSFKTEYAAHIKGKNLYGICITQKNQYKIAVHEMPQDGKVTFAQVPRNNLKTLSSAVLQVEFLIQDTCTWSNEQLRCLVRTNDGPDTFNRQNQKMCAMDSFLRCRNVVSNSAELAQYANGSLLQRMFLYWTKYDDLSVVEEYVECVDISAEEAHMQVKPWNMCVYFVYLPPVLAAVLHTVGFVIQNLCIEKAHVVLVSDSGDSTGRFLDRVKMSKINIREILSKRNFRCAFQRYAVTSDVPRPSTIMNTQKHENFSMELDAWLRNGERVTWAVIKFFPFESLERRQLQQRITSLFANQTPGVHIISIQNFISSSGSKTLMRYVAYDVNFNSSYAVIVGGKKADHETRVRLMFDEISSHSSSKVLRDSIIRILIVDEDGFYSDTDSLKQFESRCTIVVLRRTSGLAFAQKNKTVFVNPFVDLKAVDSVVKQLKLDYTDAHDSLDALLRRIKENQNDISERHIHNIIATALWDVPVSLENWMEKELETISGSTKKKLLFKLCAFGTLFGGYLSIVMLADDAEESEFLLQIRSKEVEEYCALDGLFVRYRHNNIVRGLKLWSESMALIVLFNSFTGGRRCSWEVFLLDVLKEWDQTCVNCCVKKECISHNVDEFIHNRGEDDFSRLVTLLAPQVPYSAFEKVVLHLLPTHIESKNGQIAKHILLSRCARKFTSGSRGACMKQAEDAERIARSTNMDRMARSNLGNACMHTKNKKRAIKTWGTLLAESDDKESQRFYTTQIQIATGNYVGASFTRPKKHTPEAVRHTKWDLLFPTSAARNQNCQHPKHISL